mmetsp:Transcript_50697/g.122299  ORF Transcript_50697/g.122299 Transcript_50697/m.122299 type:complete len:330 (+) Transcript_50697:87-1076(+)
MRRIGLCLALAATKTIFTTTRTSSFALLPLVAVPSSVSTFVTSTSPPSTTTSSWQVSKSEQLSSSSTTARFMSSEVVPGTCPAGSEDMDALKSWRSRLEVSMGKSRKIRGSNYVQIATVDPKNNEPRVRTVVFRGFLSTLPDDNSLSTMSGKCDDLSCLVKMCTDARSQKVSEHSYQSTAELVWWFPKTSEQYRIRGRLILVGDEKDDNDSNTDLFTNENDRRALTIARKELWGNLSDPARESFLDPIVPGASYAGDDETVKVKESIPKGGRDEEGKVVPPPDNFLLMLLDPHYVDYLNLTGQQYRQIDEKATNSETTSIEWSQQRVNP